MPKLRVCHVTLVPRFTTRLMDHYFVGRTTPVQHAVRGDGRLLCLRCNVDTCRHADLLRRYLRNF